MGFRPVYVIAEKSDGVFTIAKFGDRKFPDNVYRITRRGSRWHCDCPGAWRSGGDDKHCQMIRAYIDAGKPEMCWTFAD